MEGETKEQWKERMGIGRRSNTVSSGKQSNTTPVIADEGTFRGQQVGTRTEHRDGRVDATSTRQEIRLMPGIKVQRRKEQ